MTNANVSEEKSFFKVIVHSFFVIPFLIAVFCLLLFAGMHLLTREKRSAYDYLNDIKAGGSTKRWQGAFELSKMLSNPALLPQEDRFYHELQNVFEQSSLDDPRVRQYLALAMGRTGNRIYTNPLIKALEKEREENIPFLLYALGMIKNKTSLPALTPFSTHPNARIRSIAVVAIGNLEAKESENILEKALNDSEVNVQWGAAIGLANIFNDSGEEILLNLMDRNYLENFKEVDQQEENHLIIESLKAGSKLNIPTINKKIEELSKTDSNMKVRATALELLKSK
ncbi:MAG: HEAT repeat domain-containing protein [Candidatus Omnitrophica bacterium]|nr:HEAT repeat domain-containing protein [Candidatus Omnitrophota bacterium]